MLLNPWVRTTASQVRAEVTHYYAQRFEIRRSGASWLVAVWQWARLRRVLRPRFGVS